MSQLKTLGPSIRGVRSRAGSSALIFVVAVLAVAGAVAGPVYYSASQQSILRDSVASAPVLGRGIEVVQGGPVSGGAGLLGSELAALTAGYARVFMPQVRAVEATAFDSSAQEAIPLVTRTGVCDHLRITGSCPTARGQVVVSTSLAEANRWAIGESIVFQTWGPLTITGLYTAPVPAGDYWMDRADTYFPYEYPFTGASRSAPSGYDAMFTAASTLAGAPAGAQGNVVVDQLLSQEALRPADVARLRSDVSDLVNSQDLQSIQAVVTSNIAQTMDGVTAEWSSLQVPLVVITLQLLVLAWLVLFLLVGDATAARGPEVALAKLRGFGAWRTAAFGLAEPAFVVTAALPIGCVAGWAAAAALGGLLLRPGTHAGFPAVAALAGVAATAAGVAAVGLAAVRTLRRPVLEQWRKADQSRQDRTWVLDSLLLTGAAAGLVDLALNGEIDSARHSALALLVPGLLGLAVAVVASRLLPVACRAVASTRAAGGIAGFLALRHVARRPGGARTTILLAASFALATFAVSAWSVERTNYTNVAAVTVGAPVVVTVQAPAGRDLGSLVAAADPGGTHAAAVEYYAGSGSTTLAVDTARWSTVASWPGGGHVPARQVRLIHPPTAPPLTLEGDAVRVVLAVQSPVLASTTAVLDIRTPQGAGLTPLQLGALPASGDATLVSPLSGCPCSLENLTLVPDPALGGSERFGGKVAVRSIDVHDGSGWHPVDARLASPGSWRASGPGSEGESVGPGPDGLAWTWQLPGVDDATLSYADRPAVLPALATGLTGRTGRLTVSGLDGQDLPVDVVSLDAALPGLPSGGVVVDRGFAETAAGGNLAQVVQQVWIGPRGAAAGVVSSLRGEGVRILSSQSEDSTAREYGRSGPGLGGVLFLAEAAAAAAMAAAGAILALAVSARRRRYEMASLETTGIPVRTLTRSVVMEQVIVLAFGMAVGVLTGLAADALVLRALPEFSVVAPASLLHYRPPVGILVAFLGLGAALVISAGVAAAAVLVRGTRLAQLREGTQ